MSKDEIIAAQQALIAELIDNLRNMMDWAREISDQALDGDPDARNEWRADMRAAQDTIAKASGAA